MIFHNALKVACSFELGATLYSVSPGREVDIPDHLAERLVKNGSRLTPGPAPGPHSGVPVTGEPLPKPALTADEGRAQSTTLTERQAADILDGATVEDALSEGVAAAEIPPAADSDGTAAAVVAKLASEGIKLPGVTERRMPKGRR